MAARVRLAAAEARLRLGPEDFDFARREARRRGVRVGEGAILYARVHYGTEPWLISIGAGTWVTSGVAFYTHDGALSVLREGGVLPADARLNRYGRIAIGEHCFIGQRAIVLPGVAIGDRCIVGAGSVVTASVPSGIVIAGNPARRICTTEEYAARVLEESLDIPDVWPDAQTKARVLSAIVPAAPPA